MTRLSVSSIMGTRRGGFAPRERPDPRSLLGKLYDRFLTEPFVIVGSDRGTHRRLYDLRHAYEMPIERLGGGAYRLGRETW